MKRSLSIALLLLIGLPLISPLFAMGSNAESMLPACCRRGGEHHCMLSAAQKEELLHGEHVTVIRSKCPLFPKATASNHHQQSAFEQSGLIFTEVLSTPEKIHQVEAWARFALEGARQKRGPPSVRPS